MSHRTAMSIIEVMCASAVLAIGLGSAFSAMGTADATRRRTEDRNAAIFACQNQIENLQSMDSSALATQFASSSSFTFDVQGLTPPISAGRSQAGLVEKMSPTSSVYGCTVLRISCDFMTAGSPETVQFLYYYTRRTYGG